MNRFRCDWKWKHQLCYRYMHVFTAQNIATMKTASNCRILPLNEIMWNANLMQQGNFIDIFLARHVSGTYSHHQKH